MAKKAAKDVLEITKVGVFAGVGAGIAGQLPDADVSADVGKGVTAISGGLPTIGTLAGAGLVLRSTKSLLPKKNKKFKL